MPYGLFVPDVSETTLPRVRRSIRLPLVAYRTDAAFEKIVGC
jgi:hypothetical protein